MRPLGFVCAGDDATLRLDDPLARALDVEPDRRKPMPYTYAFTREEVPNYTRVPTRAEQLELELGLARYLQGSEALAREWDAWSAGANDVPLGQNGLATGPVAQAPSFARTDPATAGVPWWLVGERRIPHVVPFEVIPNSVVARLAEPHVGVALIGTFVSDEAALGRRFAITTDARLLPTDKLKPEAGSTFHGHDLRELGLPAAFSRGGGARYWGLEGGRLRAGARLARREFVALTGTRRVMGGEHMLEARDGRWLRSADLRMIEMPAELPRFALRGSRWIDVSIDNQLLTLWEGSKPVYATLVSTGKDGLGDPKRSLSTPQGTFRILQKHVTTSMDSDVADKEFELRDVPWVMYFKGGYALHGAYWHDDFGVARSHGCVNLSPIDARYVFEWSLPDVPEHWHGAYASESVGPGTLVRIGP